MRDKIEMFREFISHDPSSAADLSARAMEIRTYERERLLFEVLLDVRDLLNEAKNEKK